VELIDTGARALVSRIFKWAFDGIGRRHDEGAEHHGDEQPKEKWKAPAE
jgi:hypothetical protein